MQSALQHGKWAWILALALAPTLLWADDCPAPRHGSRDCPRSDYCILHYWAPTLYQVRACIRPSNLDQYPPGPATPVDAPIERNRYRCQALPPLTISPYADPASYYGRPILPPAP